MRLVKVSSNTGKVLKVLAVNLRSDVEAVDVAFNLFGLPKPDLDQPPYWQVSPDVAVKTEPQDGMIVGERMYRR